MNVTNNSITHSSRYYSEEELNSCIKRGTVSVSAILSLMEANFHKDAQIAELTNTVADLTKRVSYLEKKTLQKPGRKRITFYCNGKEITDEYLMELIDCGYYNSIGKLEKDVGAGKNQLRNRYNKAKEKLRLERRIERYGDS